jgi:hypothetical protein
MSREPSVTQGQWTNAGKASDSEPHITSGERKKRMMTRLVAKYEDLLVMAPYWIFFLAAFAIYRALITGEVLGRSVYVQFGASVVMGVLIAKMIMVGNWLKLGQRRHASTLIAPAIYDTAIYTPFVFALILLQRFIEGLLHGRSARDLVEGIASLGWKEIAARTLVIAVGFIPFFVIRELAQRMGYGGVADLLFHRRGMPPSP